MLSDNTFCGIGHFEIDTSNIGTLHLRFGVKIPVKICLTGICTL